MTRAKQTEPDTQLPTQAELEILHALWSRGPSTVREVHELLGAKGTGYTTVLKQMQVMVAKGLLVRSERFRSHVYEARIAKEKTQKRMAQNLLHQVFDGSTKSLVLGALSAQKVSSAEMAEIRKLLDKYEKEAR